MQTGSIIHLQAAMAFANSVQSNDLGNRTDPMTDYAQNKQLIGIIYTKKDSNTDKENAAQNLYPSYYTTVIWAAYTLHKHN